MYCKYRLLTPGPTMIPQEIELEMAKHIIHHRKEEFKSIMMEVQDKLKLLFGTKNEVLLLASSGTGAMQAAVFNLFNRGEKVIVIQGGKFGKRWYEISKIRDLDVILLEVPWGESVDIERLHGLLKANKDVSGILIQASETSTGVLHPVEEIGKLTKDKDILLVVDGISAVGISPLPMEKFHIDCLITGSQKGLMVPPGLSLISLSNKAWDVAKKVKRDDFYFYLLGEREKIKTGQTLYTPPVNLIYGLKVSMELLFKRPLEETYKKYWALTQMTRKGVNCIGLECFVKNNYTWGLTSVKVPKGVDGQRLVKFLAEKYNLYIAGGQEHLKGKIIRIGHMGDVDFGDILFALSSISSALKDLYGLTPQSPDFLEQALSRYEEETIKGYPGMEASN